MRISRRRNPSATNHNSTGAIYVGEDRARFIKKWSSPLIAFREFIDGYNLSIFNVAMVFLSDTFALTPNDKTSRCHLLHRRRNRYGPVNLVGIPGQGRPKARRGRLAGSLPHITFILGVIFSIVLMVRKELPESTRHMSRGP
ncbi:hypothetical protein HMPREF1301_00907 [Propionibacterium sp. KPL2005]|nr:hypothetical protein HMPREF1301_00907 [Propionibacterium sp. KPL2005]ERS29790.1 hypothetical protein HMPREF1297_00615 [Propionibacterium sp. KPL2000]